MGFEFGLHEYLMCVVGPKFPSEEVAFQVETNGGKGSSQVKDSGEQQSKGSKELGLLVELKED